MTKKRSNWVLILLAFGILISGPRFSGAFAAALGIDLFSLSPAWAWIEILSGWALALFEAVAIAYIASKFRQIQVFDEDDTLPLAQRIKPTNALYWVILLFGQIFLLLTIPAVATVHMATQVFRDSSGRAASVPDILVWRHILANFLTWTWLFITATASTLFVFLIGLVMEDFGLTKRSSREAKTFEAFTTLRKSTPIIDPIALAKEANIPLAEASEFLDYLTVPDTREALNVRLAGLKNGGPNK